jgi:hypothetical protein
MGIGCLRPSVTRSAQNAGALVVVQRYKTSWITALKVLVPYVGPGCILPYRNVFLALNGSF